MTWANADGFQVASRDNLMMLETDNFLGADGDATLGDFKQREKDATKILRRAFDSQDKKWDAFTTPYGSQIDAARNSYKNAFPFNIKMSLDELLSIRKQFDADKITWQNQKDQERGSVSAKSLGAGVFSAALPTLVLNKNEVEIFRRSSKARANIEALNQLSKELDNVIKLKEEQVKAEAEKKLAEEKKKAAIEEAKKAPSTGSPIGSSTSGTSDGILDFGTSKSNKTLMYVGIGVAILVVGYFVTRKN